MPYTDKGIYYADADTDMQIDAITAAMATSIGANLAVSQAKFGTSPTQLSTSATSYADSGLSATIQPSSTTNKILVVAFVPYYSVANSGSNFAGVDFAISRAASIVHTSTQRANIVANGVLGGVWTAAYLDEPASVDSTQYKIQYKSPSTTNTSYVSSSGGTAAKSTIVLLEIAA